MPDVAPAQTAEPQTALRPVHVSARALKRLGSRSDISQVCAIQDLLFVDLTSGELKPLERAAVARAWKEVWDVHRELSGRAKLKPQDPQPRKSRKSQAPPAAQEQ